MSELLSTNLHDSYEMYWSDAIKNDNICPNCGRMLKNDYQVYLAFIKIREETDSFITGNDAGYFCPRCPVVVLDRTIFGRELKTAAILRDRNIKSFSYFVSGIVNYGAIPEDKREKEIGTKDNPIPFIEFNVHSKKNNAKKTDSYSSKKIGRNDPCPCGSGKKYKKCCLKK